MMYRHKSLKQLLCCLLLLCLFFGFSEKLFSVNAATAPDYSPSLYASTYLDTTNSEGYTTYRVSSLQPYLNDFTYTIGDVNGHDRIYVTYDIIQDYVVSVTIQNTTGHGNILIPTSQIQCQLNIPASSKPADTANERYFYTFKGWSIDNVSGDIVSVGTSGGDNTSGYLQLLLDSEYYAGGYILLPEGYKIHGSFVIHAHHTLQQDCYNGTIYQFTNTTINNYFDCPASSFAFSNYNIQINSDRESHLSEYSLDQIENNSNLIHDQLISVLSNQQAILNAINLQKAQDITNSQNIQNEINQNDEVTQGLINSQTEQQEQQHNEIVAHSDADDSTNINSAITGGTDAVKEKMGLFSFFDGIVNSMSDILTSDHERHLVLPALDVPLPEETVHVWDRKEFDFDELENNFGALLTVVRFATVAVCYSVMISGAYNIFHKFIGVKDGDA